MWADTKRVCERAGLRTHETRVAHGTITVICGDSAFEVTTFRSDGQYKDGRHPDSVSFVSSIEEDLVRRDFRSMPWLGDPTEVWSTPSRERPISSSASSVQ